MVQFCIEARTTLIMQEAVIWAGNEHVINLGAPSRTAVLKRCVRVRLHHNPSSSETGWRDAVQEVIFA